jgi:diacylglycerol kinase family enzyme
MRLVFGEALAMKTCVIYNPTADRGRAPKRLDELRHRLGEEAVFLPTQGPDHAEELAGQAVRDGYAVVAAAGGDGTAHEVANGILRTGRPEVVLGVYPIGSANDYAFGLGLKLAGLLDHNGPLGVRHVDVGVVRAETGRERYFINGLGLGFNGAVTQEAERIRRLRGFTLYALAFLKALFFHYRLQDMEIQIDQEVRRVATFALSLAIGKREGHLLLAPQAVPDDGLFEYILAGPLSRWQVLRNLPRLATGGQLPTDLPGLWLGRCQTVKLRSETPLLVHLDGEFFCVPDDDIRSLDVRILPGRLAVQQW